MNFIIFQPNGKITMGRPPILVQQDAFCEDCKRVHDIEVCPECASFINIGYGLAFGGLGTYKFCDNDSCGWVYKILD